MELLNGLANGLAQDSQDTRYSDEIEVRRLF